MGQQIESMQFEFSLLLQWTGGYLFVDIWPASGSLHLAPFFSALQQRIGFPL